MCEYFLREESSKIVRLFFSREKILKSEYFCEHQNIGENFLREYFKSFVIKKRVKRSYSRLKKVRKKTPMILVSIWLFYDSSPSQKNITWALITSYDKFGFFYNSQWSCPSITFFPSWNQWKISRKCPCKNRKKSPWIRKSDRGNFLKILNFQKSHMNLRKKNMPPET